MLWVVIRSITYITKEKIGENIQLILNLNLIKILKHKTALKLFQQIFFLRDFFSLVAVWFVCSVSIVFFALCLSEIKNSKYFSQLNFLSKSFVYLFVRLFVWFLHVFLYSYSVCISADSLENVTYSNYFFDRFCSFEHKNFEMKMKAS